MRKKHVFVFVLLLALVLPVVIYSADLLEMRTDDLSVMEDLPAHERDSPSFVYYYNKMVEFAHGELLDAFNFIADYWYANPYCDIINALELLVLSVPCNRVRVRLDSYSEELKVAFRTHVLDSPVIWLEDARRDMNSTLAFRLLNRSISFGTEANRPNRAQLYNGQQTHFTFAELRDIMTLVSDFMWASMHIDKRCEISDAIVAAPSLNVVNNRVRVRTRDYSEEFKEAFRAKVTDSPAISFVYWR